MNERSSGISYFELIICVIILTTTFQLLLSVLSFNSYMRDEFGIIRFLLVSAFVYYNKEALASPFLFSSVLRTYLIFICYFTSIFFLKLTIMHFQPDLVESYVHSRTVELIKDAPKELSKKGYNINVENSWPVIEESVRKEFSTYRLLIYFGWNLGLGLIASFFVGFALSKAPTAR